jgi:tetratricopeptide (TPR) repeat protein
MDPEDIARAFAERAESLAASGKREAAVELFDRALEADPESVEAWIGKGRTLKGLGRAAEALECFERALEIHPSPIAEALRDGLAAELGEKRRP